MVCGVLCIRPSGAPCSLEEEGKRKEKRKNKRKTREGKKKEQEEKLRKDIYFDKRNVTERTV
jgi:hypothetical protein